MRRRNIGFSKENEAVLFLKSKGYKILERNFHSKFGEIDIIALNGNTLVFVEVRSKSYTYFGYAEETIDRRKIEKIVKTAQFYIVKNGIQNLNIRFDVITFNKEEIEHLKNAFTADF